MMKNSYKTQRVKKPYLQASLSKTHYSCDLTLWDVSRILVTDCRVTARESAWSNDSEWNKRRQMAYKPRNLVRQTPICNKFVLKFVFLLLLLLFFVFLFNFVRRGCAAGYSECCMLSLSIPDLSQFVSLCSASPFPPPVVYRLSFVSFS